MTPTDQEWIQKRAYTIWEDEGRPHGRDDIHWHQANAEFQDISTAKAQKQATTRKRAAKANNLKAQSETAASAPPARRKPKPAKQ